MKKLLFAMLSASVLLTAFVPKRKSKLKLPDEFVLVPKGTYPSIVGCTDIDASKSSNCVEIQSFYISKHEITNKQYREFYNIIATGLSDLENQKILCDSTGWLKAEHEYKPCEPMMSLGTYYRHPVFNNYPVVNIPYEGAEAYCKWLQQKMSSDNPNFEIEVKLPSKTEWIYAAQGGRSQAMYPWGNYYLRNKKGEFMCNFKRIGDGAIYRNKSTGKPEIAEGGGEYGGLNAGYYTAEVKSFIPNGWGLYNMCGNAAEMIAEKGIAMGGSWNDYGGDVQIKAEARYDGPAPTVGFRPIIIAKQIN